MTTNLGIGLGGLGLFSRAGGLRLDLDFADGLYALGGAGLPTFPSGWAYTRTGVGAALDLAGAVVPFAADVPRVTNRGILLEVEATNLLVKTQEFDSVLWTKDNGGGAAPVVTADAGVAPDGTTTADRLVLDKTGGVFSRIAQGVVSASAVHTFSVWMKTYAGGTANVGLRLSTEAGVNHVVTGAWQRFSVTLAAPGANPSSQIMLWDSIAGNDETADLLVWGAQIETGATATSYIPTTVLPVTRAVDVATQTVPVGASTYTATYSGGTTATGAVTPGASFDLVTGRPWLGGYLERLVMR